MAYFSWCVERARARFLLNACWCVPDLSGDEPDADESSEFGALAKRDRERAKVAVLKANQARREKSANPSFPTTLLARDRDRESRETESSSQPARERDRNYYIKRARKQFEKT